METKTAKMEREPPLVLSAISTPWRTTPILNGHAVEGQSMSFTNTCIRESAAPAIGTQTEVSSLHSSYKSPTPWPRAQADWTRTLGSTVQALVNVRVEDVQDALVRIYSNRAACRSPSTYACHYFPAIFCHLMSATKILEMKPRK